MDQEDIVYILILFGCIIFGRFYVEVREKKWIGTVLGFFIVLIVSGLHILHPILSTLCCALIIKYANKKKCHIICFVFMFSYLLFFRVTHYFGIPNPPGHTNLIQMIITLKIVGLAFEINSAHIDFDRKNMSDRQNEHEKQIYKNIKLDDIFHYTFNYVGLLTGPYYRYRTYYDYLHFPFKNHANCGQATINKLMWIPLYVVVYLATTYFWPINYATSIEFYEERSIFYRFMYVWPTFLIFRMRMYIGITLSECVCTMAGFGAYPESAKSRAGCGPTIDYLDNVDKLDVNVVYDFETIHNIDAYTTDTCITFREAMKSWNMCVQYWLAVNVYKRFPIKAYKVLITLFVSAYWHGVYSGYYFCILGAPFYLPIEDLHNKAYRQNATGTMRKLIDIGFWISKFFAFSYMGIAFLLLTLDKIWFYYSSVYHLGYIYFFVLFIIGLVLNSRHKSATKLKEQ